MKALRTSPAHLKSEIKLAGLTALRQSRCESSSLGQDHHLDCAIENVTRSFICWKTSTTKLQHTPARFLLTTTLMKLVHRPVFICGQDKHCVLRIRDRRWCALLAASVRRRGSQLRHRWASRCAAKYHRSLNCQIGGRCRPPIAGIEFWWTTRLAASR